MSFNFAALFVWNKPTGFDRVIPTHDQSRARALIEDLKLPAWSGSQEMGFIQALTMRGPDTFALGAYAEATIYRDRSLYGDVLIEANPLLHRFVTNFIDYHVLFVELVGSMNAFGYSLYCGGSLLRAFAGSSDEGFTTDVGQLLPEEESYKSRLQASTKSKSRFARRDAAIQPQDSEALAFSLTTRFFGCPLDNPPRIEGHPPGWNLDMEVFQKKDIAT